jgi:hypothetical protein
LDVLPTQPYLEQAARWPASGRHVLAHFDDTSIVVYQAYRPSIGRYAIEHQALGGPNFGFRRMSWIKPNFLWMMYRSAWGTSEGQEVVLGLRLRRTFFDRLLAEAVPSTHVPEKYESRESWQAAVKRSSVRLQWDPDHDPSGATCERRAIQLGLRGDALGALASSELVEVLDMTALIAAQREHRQREAWSSLRTPEEHPYRPANDTAARNVGLEAI